MKQNVKEPENVLKPLCIVHTEISTHMHTASLTDTRNLTHMDVLEGGRWIVTVLCKDMREEWRTKSERERED